jgi:putative ABC transport system permease protein
VSPLHRKLLRDIVRLWPQALAIALVMAAGVATLILAVGAHASLAETRAAYYERNRFADVFANVTRAPNAVAAEIAEIAGVGAVETRISKIALLDLPNVLEPASANFVSVPDYREQALNQLTLRQGRYPIAADDREVIVSEPFANAHDYQIGSTFSAILNGQKRELRIVGIALSPEFIYALGPWDLMPDDRRFGIVWMSDMFKRDLSRRISSHLGPAALPPPDLSDAGVATDRIEGGIILKQTPRDSVAHFHEFTLEDPKRESSGPTLM